MKKLFYILSIALVSNPNDMIWYDMIWYDMIWYYMIWYDMIWYMMWYYMIYDMKWIIWYDIVSHNMILIFLKIVARRANYIVQYEIRDE